MINTTRTHLRPLSLDDVHELYAYRSLHEVYKYHLRAPQTVDDAKTFIEKYSVTAEITPGHWKQFAIYLRSDDALIGDCGFCIFEEVQAEIGFTISPKYQRRGYGIEVVRALVAYLFTEHNLHRIIAKTYPANVGSKTLLERLHFRQEAHLIKCVKVRGEWQDDLVYALLRQEWRNPAG